MNDHLPKPVDPDRLYRCLLQWLPPAPGQRVQPPAAAPTAVPPPSLPERLAAVAGIDLAAGLACTGGSLPVLERALRGFERTYADGDAALARSATPAHLHAACHSLRGACAVVGATGLQQQLAELERAADAGVAADDPAAAWAALQPSIQAVLDRLTSLSADLRRAFAGDI